MAGILGYINGKANKRKEASKYLEILYQCLEKPVSFYHFDIPVSIAVVYIGMGDYTNALHWLNIAYKERASTLIMLKTDPIFDPLRSNREFKKLIKEMRFG